MEEPKKKKEHEELTRKRRTEKGSSDEKQTLQKIYKEKIQKKGKRRETCKTSGQNTRGKTETCSHDEHILAINMAFNCSNIKTIINAQYMKYKASNKFVLISSNRQQFEQGGS